MVDSPADKPPTARSWPAGDHAGSNRGKGPLDPVLELSEWIYQSNTTR